AARVDEDGWAQFGLQNGQRCLLELNPIRQRLHSLRARTARPPRRSGHDTRRRTSPRDLAGGPAGGWTIGGRGAGVGGDALGSRRSFALAARAKRQPSKPANRQMPHGNHGPAGGSGTGAFSTTHGALALPQRSTADTAMTSGRPRKLSR